MSARIILAVLAAVFGVLSIGSWSRHRSQLSVQERTWLLVALIFGGIAAALSLAPGR
jgi:hypothetical protein